MNVRKMSPGHLKIYRVAWELAYISSWSQLAAYTEYMQYL